MTHQIDFVISDTHFYHANILKYEPCRQAWGADVDAMTETMVQAWNSVVNPGDTVLHLGDVAMGKKDLHPLVRTRLNGSIVLVKGNHDSKPEKNFLDPSRGDELHAERLEFTQDGQLYICRHDPMHFLREEAERAYRLLFGHLHGNDYQSETPEFTRKKGLCLSVERLPSAPAPMRFSELSKLNLCEKMVTA